MTTIQKMTVREYIEQNKEKLIGYIIHIEDYDGYELFAIKLKKETNLDNISDTLLYSGFCKNVVHLGGYVILFGELFKNYEFLYKGDWMPFGVEE